MKRENINNGWLFFRNASSIDDLATMTGEPINLPHTWNNIDGTDGGNDYYRAKCYYLKHVDIMKKDDMDYYLEFEGANSIAYVYVNGVFVGEHRGGYSRFRMRVTSVINTGENVIVVAVDNSPNDEVYPSMADFTFYGGIYRDVNMIEAPLTRFDLDYYGSDGVMVTPRVREDGSAHIEVESYLVGELAGKELAICVSVGDLEVHRASVSAEDATHSFDILEPMLWDGTRAPILYTLRVSLMDGAVLLDEREVHFGIRQYSVDADGFYLNGRKYTLRGVSRHQDREGKGNAITREDHEMDMTLIKDMGANAIRLAHYQHDGYFYDLADKAGMVVWAEIPYISIHLDDGDDNAMLQMRELVVQNYNHPSILFWGISNEITIGGESDRQLALHKRLNALVKELDDTRLTTMACVTMCDTDSPLLDVPDIIAYNHYFGWYVGDVEMNGEWLDEFRAKYPKKPIAISEYGAEAVLAWHSSHPERGDYTEEYQAQYHERILEIFEARPYLWATFVWNMFDFGVDARDEGGVKGRNNKGLVTYDRETKKDSYYLYKAHWSEEPFVHICSKRYALRAEKSTKIRVYSNASKVDLYVGDRLIDSKTGTYVFEFFVNLSLFGTRIKAVAGGASDTAKFRRVLSPRREYILSENSGVDNWFEVDGKRYEMREVEGMFSVRDTFNDIVATEAGKATLYHFVGEMMKNMSPNADAEKFFKSSAKLIGGMSIARIAKLAGNKMSPEALYALNEELVKIPKGSKGGK